MVITFRPHHFLCAYCFQGEGYSNEFVNHFRRIHQQLENHPSTEISVTHQADDICQPCPHRQGTGCETIDKIKRLDTAHQHYFQWPTDQSVTWQTAKQRIQQLLDIDNFHRICDGCSWKPLGICEKAIIQKAKPVSDLSEVKAQ